MSKTTLEERVKNFLQMRPNAAYIPLHPDDYEALYRSDNLGAFDRPIKCLGTMHKPERDMGKQKEDDA